MKKKYLFILGLFVVFGCSDDRSTDNQELFDLANKKEKLSEESIKLDEEISSYLSQYSPLPSKAENSDNVYTKEKLKLGHYLYFDSALSLTGNNSCNSCHNLATYGVDNLPTSIGDKGENGTRNSPTVLNAALHSSQFWDGRAKDVEEQAGMPILNPVEMAIPNEKHLEDKLRKIERYKNLFVEAFPNDETPIVYSNISKALAIFERDLLTPSRFDKYLKGDKLALSEKEKKGFLLFNTLGCNACHNGVAVGGSLVQKFGVYGDYWLETKSEKIDKGKFEETKLESDMYMFKSPSLRNVEKTAPYFHDGSVASLEESIKIMGKIQLNKELSNEQINDLVAFLKTLTGDIKDEYKKSPLN